MNKVIKPYRGHSFIQPLVRRIVPEWTDYNAHLNVTWISYLFDLATDNMLDALAIGESYAARACHSTFALEAHIRYLGEVKEGDDIEIHSYLIAVDNKRIHYFHEMIGLENRRLLASLEQISIHVDLSAGLSAEWPDDIRKRLDAAAEGAEGLSLCKAISLHQRG